MSHTHTMPDGTVVEHDHAEPHGATQEEIKLIMEFNCAVESAFAFDATKAKWTDDLRKQWEKIVVFHFLKAFNGIGGVVDCYIHNSYFRNACERAGIRLVYGRKADRCCKHAYVAQYGPAEGAICTIQTDIDLDPHDSTIPWANHDLFDDHHRIQTFGKPTPSDSRLVIRYKEEARSPK